MRGAQITGVKLTAILKFHTIASDICGSAVWNVLHFLHQTPRILRWLLDFWKTCAPLDYTLRLMSLLILWMFPNNTILHLRWNYLQPRQIKVLHCHIGTGFQAKW